MESVLVIDDEVGIRTAIQQVLQDDATEVHVEATSEGGVNAFMDLGPNVVLLDIRLGTDSGIDTFRKIRQIDPRALVIFITGHGTTQLAIESMKMGAFDYLVKPLDLNHLQTIVRQALKISQTMRLPAAVTQLESKAVDSDRIVGASRSMQEICKNIGRIAPQDINVLILGESGTGKELIARAIYHHSRRANSTFLAINCAAIPENLLESELFGHEQGAFTGADRRRIGKFEQCHKGTIFLDEIGDMPLATQAKMLRLLQDGEIQRVGGNEVIQTDVRIVAATHQNLEAMIARGQFRRDLYYRLRGVTVQLPPLRDRVEDIAELSHYFLFRFNPQLGTHVETIAEEAIHRLQSYSWPGNIRELQSVIKQAMIASTGPTLLEEFLPEEVLVNNKATEELIVAAQPVGPDAWAGFGAKMESTLELKRFTAYRECIGEFDRILVQRVLRLTEGNQQKAAEWLGISRPTLRAKLRAFLDKPTNSGENE
ncbi:MAG: sigma-54 dependent transcriptional regulator [Pirellulales bacterium]